MAATSTDQLFDDYLSRLRVAAGGLPPEQRDELLSEISEHLDAAKAAGEANTEAGVRQVLDRLGSPAEIVQAATGSEVSSTISTRPMIVREGFAAFFLTFGSIIPVIGWLIGVVLLWTSKRISLVYKIFGTLIVPLGPFVLAPIVTNRSLTECSSVTSISGETTSHCVQHGIPTPWYGFVIMAIYFAPALLAMYYLRAASRHTRTEPLEVRPRSVRKWGGLETAAVICFAAGWFVAPGINIIAALICTWKSNGWTQREKVIATLISAVAMVPVLALIFVITTTTIYRR